MAEEISNRTLAILLVVAIAISLGGTIVSLNRLANVQAPVITGFAGSDVGTATVNISSQASIKFNVSSVNFGNGWVNTSQGEDSCRMSAEGDDEASSSSSACTDEWDDDDWVALQIENDGNVNITVNVSTDGPASEFVGTGGGFWFRVNESKTGSCNSTNSLNASVDSQWTAWPASDKQERVCSYLDYNDARDTLWLHLQVNVSYLSQYVGTGARTANITAYGVTATP